MNNCKIYVNGQSMEIQEKLLKLGVKWEGAGRYDIKSSANPFLIIKDNIITASANMDLFMASPYPEISAEEILNMTIEQQFSAGEAVLCREDNEAYVWEYDIYSHYDPKETIGFRHHCVGNVWAICIPFKGNEHLVGTNK